MRQAGPKLVTISLSLILVLTGVILSANFSQAEVAAQEELPVPVVEIIESPFSEQEVLSLINQARVEAGLSPLVLNKRLTVAATLKAEDMAEGGYFSHNSPDGKEPWFWFNEVGYKFQSAGENLAVRFWSSDKVVKAWLKSPTHRANIVDANYLETGIGVGRGIYKGQEVYFIVQLFGRAR